MKKLGLIFCFFLLNYCGDSKQDFRADILIVLDNSGSMSFYKDSVKKGLNLFFEKLDKSFNDYRIAITTTDMSQAGKRACFTNSKAELGKSKGFYISSDKKDKKKLFSEMLDLAEIGKGSADEEIFRPILGVLDVNKTRHCNEDFRRKDVHFISIFVGDSQDSVLSPLKDLHKSFFKHIKRELFSFYALIPNAGESQNFKEQCFIDLDNKNLGFSHLKEFSNSIDRDSLMDLCSEPYEELLENIRQRMKDLD